MGYRNYSQTLSQNVKIDQISGSITDSFIQFAFIVCQIEGYRNMLKLSCRPIVFTSYKDFLKSKKRYGTGFSASFSARFLKKNIFLVIFY